MDMKKTAFEDNIKRIEEIIRKIEGSQISLDDSVKYFEEGMKLIKECEIKLESTKQKVVKLVSKDGIVVEEPLDTGEEDEL
ncbi:MAG TPA: exodeoxyribonuclease VII small subunit [Eubacteriaceae bacterium]|jgi:exodeoxyribonuclease VII small subunit|nr:exodeoxyribonuclease VII small subunit [Eubacteriaceae bacterium]